MELLNEDIMDAMDRDGYFEDDARLQKSQVLGSEWTRAEKTAFFNHLTVLGRDRLDEVAKAIGTKSIIECRAYLLTLDHALFPIKEYGVLSHRELVKPWSIPAAVELTDECVEALDKQALNVERRRRLDEERYEKERWGGTWLIDTDMAYHLDGLMKAGDVEAVNEIAPEAELLNPDKMLELSERYVTSHDQLLGGG